MKNFALLSLFAGLLACGQNSAPSQTASLETAKTNVFTFSADHRLLDGPFQSITLTRDEYGTFTAQLHVITSGFGTPSVDYTNELGSGLTCYKTTRGNTLLSVNCSADLRPADGLLIELDLVRGEDGLLNASLHRAAYSTLTSPELNETTEIAYGLSLEP